MGGHKGEDFPGIYEGDDGVLVNEEGVEVDENGDEIFYDEDVVSTQKGTAEDMVRIVADNGGEATFPVIEDIPDVPEGEGRVYDAHS